MLTLYPWLLADGDELGVHDRDTPRGHIDAEAEGVGVGDRRVGQAAAHATLPPRAASKYVAGAGVIGFPHRLK